MANKWKENWQDGRGLGSAMGMASGAAPLFTSAYNMATPDIDSVENNVDAQIEAMRQNQPILQADSMDDLMAKWASNKLLRPNAKAEDYYNGPSDRDVLTGTLSSTISGATTGSMAGPFGALAGAVVGLGSRLIGGLLGKDKAQTAAEEAAGRINAERNRQNAYRQASFQIAAENLTSKNNRMLASQISAYGGPLGISLLPVGGAIDYIQNEELLSSFSDNMSKSNNNKKTPMPVFAFGGALGGYGGDWSNGLNFIKAGKRHEQNPIGGVPMGVAQDGMPNLVEEGEVVWNDYVFSNRINVPKETMERLGIKGKDTMTFAEAVEKAQKSSAERPNDPIEKRGLDAVLASLMQKQEEIRQSKAEEEQFNEMEDMTAFAADGGPIHIAKNKKGTFTAAATKHGMGVQEFASHVLANKDKYSSSMVKKAVFAHNAKSWSHALGGHLFDWGGHFDENGNWIPDPMPKIDWNLPKGKSIFSEGYNAFPKAQAPSIDLDEPEFGWKYWTPPTTLNFKPNGINKPMKQDPYSDTTKNPNLPTSGWQSYLRYAPVLGSALLLGHTLANKPDYSYANELEEAANQYASSMNTNITPRFLGDYLAYRPFDRLFYANELGAQEAAERAAIMQASNGNTGAAMAGLLASGYNRNVGLGKLFREGDEYNLAQRQKVAEFNRATNQYNSQADLAAQQTNARLNAAKAEMLLNNKYRTTAMKQAIDDARANTIAANLSGLFDSLGGIGTEAQQKYWMNGLINSGWAYTPSEDMLAAWGYPRACGGKMNRRKKKGITI